MKKLLNCVKSRLLGMEGSRKKSKSFCINLETIVWIKVAMKGNVGRILKVELTIG